MSERARVERAIRADLDRVVPDVVATIREQIPAYRSLSPAQTEEVSAIAGWATSRILELWVAGGDLSAADVQRFRGIGAARALDGRPLPVVLRAYRVAGTRVTDLVAEVGGDRLTVDDAGRAGQHRSGTRRRRAGHAPGRYDGRGARPAAPCG
jgi:hypothetical protein